MTNLIFLLVGFWAGYKWAQRRCKGCNSALSSKEYSKNNLAKYFDDHERVKNDDVQELLGVSDATATRYLDEMEKDGKIRQVGEAGRHVYYEKT